ncbi:MAG: hypothetical protein HW388_1520 [Dehalococcoidia bacterium]|nr:hypothetical protein [Dehalococcoidia bacterium]
MPNAVLDVERCQPERCDRGICLARIKCPVKALWQEDPYDVPFLSGGRCNGCSVCVLVCPAKAIHMS